MAVPPALPRPYANVSTAQARAGIDKITRRMQEIVDYPDPRSHQEAIDNANTIATKINATYREIFRPETVEAHEGLISISLISVRAEDFHGNEKPISEQVLQFNKGRTTLLRKLKTTAELLHEMIDASENEDETAKILSAYNGLSLHPDIAEAASDLYRNGHYANAIEDAVKALNNLVRLKSGEEQDGEALMNYVFSPKMPRLAFNDLADTSDTDEQRGFMMMFAGAVAGLRNPRAHKLIKDDAERSLEFIAYISLLAKLLARAKKMPVLPSRRGPKAPD